MKAGSLRNVTIACHKFKYMPMYERSGKCIQSLFKEYQDALLENEGSIGFLNFHDIVNLLTLSGESKSGLSTYYIKFRRENNVFDRILDRIGQMEGGGWVLKVQYQLPIRKY